MIDLGVLTWSQQWEFWIATRLLRPDEFVKFWRWDFLLVPDQVWLLVGAYRGIKALVFSEGVTLWSRFQGLGAAMRADPLLFLAFGLIFVAEPHVMGRLRVRFAEVVEPEDVDEAIALEEEERVGRMNPEYAVAIEAAQAGNQTVIPASVLNSCRTCKSDKVAATNLIVNCGHFPFCDECVKKSPPCSLCASKGIEQKLPVHVVGMTSKDLDKPPTIVNVAPNVKVNKSCGVCQEREGLLTLMPCGHLLFCGPCVLGFKMRCPFCRTRITRAIRSFDVRHHETSPVARTN